jgi:catechol 2,3-dioxygenase-like lactoylglutathione lyase family enzyme
VIRAYIVAMSPAVESMVAVTYVRDIDTARAFYELLGFSPQSSGQGETSAWLVLRQGPHTVLLTCTTPPLGLPALPLLFYFWYDDLSAVLGALEAAGTRVDRLGHAPHAEGGEARVRDPDGNTILLGQRARSEAAAQGDQEAESRFSLLREAAALVSAGGRPGIGCQVGAGAGQSCPEPAEVRLADSAGTAVWACLPHAEEILVMVPGAFVASEEGTGIARFLRRGHG